MTFAGSSAGENRRLVGIMGESGSGKTSLLNAIAGFAAEGLVGSGEIYLTSEACARVSRSAVAFVHHNHNRDILDLITLGVDHS